MDLMEQLRDKARANVQKVAFFEGDNPKMMETVGELAKEGLAECYLVGDAAVLRSTAEQVGVDLSNIHVVDVTDADANEEFAQRFEAAPDCPLRAKGIRRRAKRPMDRALMMQRIDDVDITFGGIDCSTGDVIIGGQTMIGLADGVDTISSLGIFNIPGWEGSEGHLLGFGDAAVCVDPDPEQLASIAISAAETVQALMGWEPRVAMLSYSTDGSAESALVDKVRAAVKVAQERRPDLKIDGEFQLDSAIVPAVAEKKVRRESAVAGKANVLICPDINVGNIGVKLVQNFAHADAYGPMLQGFKKIVCDCSRSAPVSELVGNVVMSCVRSQALKGE
ncbi:MAG: phosphate acetyltransferase [Atopobiaceae bacterium]|nr:phosphate acetyltransferase [Atopobiaceae bacterium]